METVTSNGIEYYLLPSGTCYHKNTDLKLAKVIERLMANRTRIRLWYGENGKAWDEEHYIMGYIGRSTGNVKIPLLIYNTRSYGGGALLDHCIVKIIDSKTKHVYYQHPKFSQKRFEAKLGSNVEGYNAQVLADGEIYANCKTFEKAQKLAFFMQGYKNTK